MKPAMRWLCRCSLLLLALAVLHGCGSSLYRITDQTTGRTYEVEAYEQLPNGSVLFQNEMGNSVIINDAKVQEIEVAE